MHEHSQNPVDERISLSDAQILGGQAHGNDAILMHNLKTFLSLAPRHRAIFLEALVLLPAVAIALRLSHFRRCQAALARHSSGPLLEPDEAGVREARNIAGLIRAAARHGLCRATCLPQSLVLWFMLRRRQLIADLRIGVRKPEDDLQAHAWVEIAGRALDDRSTDRVSFATFDRPIEI